MTTPRETFLLTTNTPCSFRSIFIDFHPPVSTLGEKTKLDGDNAQELRVPGTQECRSFEHGRVRMLVQYGCSRTQDMEDQVLNAGKWYLVSSRLSLDPVSLTVHQQVGAV